MSNGFRIHTHFQGGVTTSQSSPVLESFLMNDDEFLCHQMSENGVLLALTSINKK